MDKFSIVVAVFGIIGTLSSIYFAYVACKKNGIEEIKIDSKKEGTIVSDIGYIKSCLDRVEKNLSKVEERYQNILERIVKVEESILSLNKRVDEFKF